MQTLSHVSDISSSEGDEQRISVAARVDRLAAIFSAETVRGRGISGMLRPFHAHFAQPDDRRWPTHHVGLGVRRGLIVCWFLLCFLASIQFPELAHGRDNHAPVWEPEIRITGTPGSMVGFYARFSDWGERGEAFSRYPTP